MDIMGERNRIGYLLAKQPKEISNVVLKNLEKFKLFAGIEIITENLDYVVYNEIEKVKKELNVK